MVFNPVLKNQTIEIITGCMFSGKTEELIRRIKLARNEGLATALFKPEIDKRYHEKDIVSHKGSKIESFVIGNSKEILSHSKNIDVIGIDEAQFFDRDIVEVCQNLITQKCRVIIAGLEKDFMGKPFGAMPELIAVSNNVTRLNAICHQCGDKAFHTYKKTKSDTIVEIGENNIYEARCEECYTKEMGQN